MIFSPASGGKVKPKSVINVVRMHGIIRLNPKGGLPLKVGKQKLTVVKSSPAHMKIERQVWIRFLATVVIFHIARDRCYWKQMSTISADNPRGRAHSPLGRYSEMSNPPFAGWRSSLLPSYVHDPNYNPTYWGNESTHLKKASLFIKWKPLDVDFTGNLEI